MGHSSATERASPSPKPFLRWAGGKQQIVDGLVRCVPQDWQKLRYVEPFAGAGSLFFALGPRKVLLSDANAHLIDCYQQVATSPRNVSKHLQRHAALSSERHYYQVRHEYNRGRSSPRQAARFIYLNKACFNGIFRVNTKGQFNVPYGRKEPPVIPSPEELTAAAVRLRRATLRACTYEDALEGVTGGDLVYLDPPYPPLNGTSYFTHYTAERFGGDAQEQLADTVEQIDSVGARFMMSNADTSLIRSLYKRFNIIRLPVIRYVTCKSRKHCVSELVVTNY